MSDKETPGPRRNAIPLVPILQGMGVTLHTFFKKPVTVEYPEVKRPVADRFRGRIYLKLETCIGCTLCAQACPNDSIRMGKEYETGATVRDFDYKPDRLSQNEASLGRGPFK